MVDLGLMEKMKSRPPPTSDLIAAWRAFFDHKAKTRESTNQYHAGIILTTFKHLQVMAGKGEDFLNEADLTKALKHLSFEPKDSPTTHNKLARVIYEELMHLAPENALNHLRGLVRVLAWTGDATEARDMWQKHCIVNPFSDMTSAPTGRWSVEHWIWLRLWIRIMQGFVKENNEVELIKTFEIAQSLGMPYLGIVQSIMVKFFAATNDIKGVKRWYNKPVVNEALSTPLFAETLAIVLKCCIKNADTQWCKGVFRDVLEGTPNKETWDVVLQWAAGAMGKGVEDVDRMLDVMIKRNPDNSSIRPDAATINGLVDLAVSLKDPYLAERYIALGVKRGIRPNAKTLILQLEYRADAKDLVGAQAVYKALQSEEVVDDTELPAINKYIRALCADEHPNYDRITDIASDLEEQQKRLEPDTVSSLCILHLHRGAIPEVIDLLQVQSYNYTIDERSRIIDVFMLYILDRNNTTARAWDGYTVVRQIFDEMSTTLRTKCMNEFFARGRCDMACYVFGHMRQHDIHTRRPNVETYIQCFEGIAECEDQESLHMVHNMMKMDSSIEPTTRLYNSLMLAYTSCDDAHRALDFWDDITNSNEGPSYSSLEIVFTACGRKPFGDMKAREIWNKMRRMEIEVTSEVFASYVGALAGQGKYEEARDMVENMEADLGLKPDVLTYVTLHLNN
jgi:pentatricopeptide repeat protein